MATDPKPTVKYTGLETCPKCGKNDIAAGYDKQNDVVNLNCRNCNATWQVLPLDEPMP